MRKEREPMPSSLALHIEKHKIDEVNPIALHDLRQEDDKRKHKNKNIDNARTGDNITIFERKGTARQNCKEIINRHTSKKPRKDAVVCITTTVQLGGDLKDAPKEVKEAVIREADRWLDDWYCTEKNNSKLYTKVHNDETELHSHRADVPITKDGRLCAKEIVNKPMLQTMQAYFLKDMQKAFPSLQFERKSKDGRSIPNGANQDYFEQITAKEKTHDKREKELNRLEADLSDLIDLVGKSSTEVQKNAQAVADGVTKVKKKEQEQSAMQRQLKEVAEHIRAEREKITRERLALKREREQGQSLLNKLDRANGQFKELAEKGGLTPRQHRELADVKENKNSIDEQVQSFKLKGPSL